MKGKTSYTATDSALKAKTIFTHDRESDGYGGYRYHEPLELMDVRNSLPKVGTHYLVWRRDYVGFNPGRRGDVSVLWSDDKTALEEGIPGNANRTIRAKNGWRGTTDDVSVYAHGVRECKRAEIITFESSTHIVVEFGPIED